MRDYEVLAHNLINNSVKLKANEKVLIEYSDVDDDFLIALQNEAFKVKGMPFFKNINRELRRVTLERGDDKLFELMASFDEKLYSSMDAIILVRGEHNMFDYAYVPPKNLKSFDAFYNNKIHMQIRLKKRWVLLKYPTASFAQSSAMPTRDFREYFYKICNLDYGKLCKAMDGLKALMEKTDKVKIEGPNTNLTFSIKGMPAIKCCGECNIPDGEIYTAPIKNSINGKISFNIPAMYNGIKHENIVLEFKDGKVIKASGNYSKELNQIVNTDSGSCYVGEFAFGVNPYVTYSLNDILFDEKMGGSIHMALGNAYDDCFNGNVIVVHWDLILNQMPDFGGGSIYFDEVKIRDNGRFILPELVALNPENVLN